MTYLEKSIFDKIVNLLTPHLADMNDRRAFVVNALYSSEDLRNQIDFSGSADTFTTLLVTKCVEVGLIPPNLLAVVALLVELRTQVGEEKQQEIDELIQDINDGYASEREAPNTNLARLPRVARRKPRPGFYDWNRLWYSRSSNAPVYGSANELHSFFLGAPSFRQNMRHLEDLEHIPCLILLGEPGLGKTESLRSEFYQISDTYGDEKAMFVDLSPVDSASYIHQAIFEQTKYKQWKSGNHHLHLFLDSLDRTGFSKEQTIQTIVNELQNTDISRLTLRIACRDLEWSFSVSSALEDLWQSQQNSRNRSTSQPNLTTGNGNQDYADVSISESRIISGEYIATTNNPVQIYQLAPLTHRDIIIAADANGIDSHKFLRYVIDHEVLVLAQIPIILNFMLKDYKETSGMGTSRHDIYRRGCLRLCKQNNTSTEAFVTDMEKRFRTAQRVMATLVLSNKNTVTYEQINEMASTAQIYVGDIIKPNNKEDEKLVKEALSTGLFKDPDSRVFIHRSVAEYMTAEYLVNSGCDIQQIISLLTGKQGKFAQQLVEVVRWLLEIGAQSLANAIARIQPALFVSMDLSAINPQTFSSVLERLLNIEDEYQYIDLMKYVKRQTKPIPSTDLSKIVRPYLQKTVHSDYKRRFVVEIIRTFDLPNFDSELLKIILDAKEDSVLRRLAAAAIYDNGTSEAKQKLRPFIYGVPSDPDDELKGYALLSLWSDFMTAEELFQVLVPPKRDSYAGSYALFISVERMLQPLKVEDLPVALRWVSRQPRDHEQVFRFRNITYSIMQMGWDNFHLNEMQQAFAEATLSRIMHYDSIFGSSDRWLPSKEPTLDYNIKLIEQTNQRRQLIKILAQEIISRGLKPNVILNHRIRLLTVDDFDWLTEQLENSSNGDENKFWATILFDIFTRSEYTVGRVKTIRLLSNTHTNLHDLTKEILKEIDDVKVVIRQQEERERIRREFAQASHLPDPHDPAPSERIESTLQKIESGEHSQWIQLVFDMLLETPSGQYSLHDTYPDATLFPGWKEASNETRSRIIDAATFYLSTQDELPNKDNQDSEHWLSTSSVPWVEITGYLALFLLTKMRPEYVEELEPHIWHRWADAIVWYPVISGYRTDRKELDISNQQLQYWIVQQMFQKAPTRALSALELMIDKEDRGSYVYVLRKFELAWNEKLETFLISKLSTNLAPESKATILEFMLRQDSKLAVEWSEKLVSDNYASTEKRDLVIAVIVRVMEYAKSANWSILWNAISFSDDIGTPVVEKVADWHDIGINFLPWLSEDELADLYIWLERKYSSEEDPDIDGMHTVSTRESIGRWRNSIHTHLRNRKTEEATSEIVRIANAFPDVAWLQYTRIEAENGLSDIGWTPITPDEVINLGNKSDIESETPEISSASKRDWNLIIAVIGLIIAIFACIFPIYQPEIRNFIGLSNDEQPSTSTIVPERTEPVVFQTAEPILDITPEVTPEAMNSSELTPELTEESSQ